MDWTFLIRVLLLLSNSLVKPALSHRILASDVADPSSQKFYFHPIVNHDHEGNPKTLIYGFMELQNHESPRNEDQQQIQNPTENKQGYQDQNLHITDGVNEYIEPEPNGYKLPNVRPNLAEEPQYSPYNYDEEKAYSVNVDRDTLNLNGQNKELYPNGEGTSPERRNLQVVPYGEGNRNSEEQEVVQPKEVRVEKNMFKEEVPEAQDKSNPSDQDGEAKVFDPYGQFWRDFFSHNAHKTLLESMGGEEVPEDGVTEISEISQESNPKKQIDNTPPHKPLKQVCEFDGQYLPVPDSKCEYSRCTSGLVPVRMACPEGTEVTMPMPGQTIVHICGAFSKECSGKSVNKQKSVTETTTTSTTSTTTTVKLKPKELENKPNPNFEDHYGDIHQPEAKRTPGFYQFPEVFLMYPKEQNVNTEPPPIEKTEKPYRNIQPIYRQEDNVYQNRYEAFPENILKDIASRFSAPNFYPDFHTHDVHRQPSFVKPVKMTYPEIEISKRDPVVPQLDNPAPRLRFYYGTEEEVTGNKENHAGRNQKTHVSRDKPLQSTTMEYDTIKSTTEAVPVQPTECQFAGQMSCVDGEPSYYYECINGALSLMKIKRPCPPGTTVKHCHSVTKTLGTNRGNQFGTKSLCSGPSNENADHKENIKYPPIPNKFTQPITTPVPIRHRPIYHRHHFHAQYPNTRPQYVNTRNDRTHNGNYYRPIGPKPTIRSDLLKLVTTRSPTQRKTTTNEKAMQKPLTTTPSGQEIESIEHPTPWYMKLFDHLLPLGRVTNSYHGKASFADPTKMSPFKPSDYPGHAMSGSPFVPYRGSNKFGNPQPSQDPQKGEDRSTYVKKSDTVRAPHVGYDLPDGHSNIDPFKDEERSEEEPQKTTQSPALTSKSYTLNPHVKPTPSTYWRARITKQTAKPTTTDEPFESANAYQYSNYYYHY